MAKMNVTLCGVPLDNPIIPASGTFGFGYEFADIYDLHIRTVAEDYYVGLDNTTNKHAYVFKDKDIDKGVFLDKADALEKLMEIKGE